MVIRHLVRKNPGSRRGRSGEDVLFFPFSHLNGIERSSSQNGCI